MPLNASADSTSALRQHAQKNLLGFATVARDRLGVLQAGLLKRTERVRRQHLRPAVADPRQIALQVPLRMVGILQKPGTSALARLGRPS